MKHSAAVRIANQPKATPIRPISMQARREEAFANALLSAIALEFGGNEYFTREDCLYLSVVQHIAKITAYREICIGLDRLKRNRQITEIARGELVIAGREDHVRMEPVADQYEHTITALVHALLRRTPAAGFGVMHIVNDWHSDPHLTTNAKRVGVRQVLRRLAKRDVLIAHDDHTYSSRAFQTTPVRAVH